MKITFLIIALSVVGILNLPAGQYQITERGPDYRVWSKTTLENGTNHVHRYVELATGMYYTNSYGQLAESSEQISVQPGGGAAATQGRHQVYFPDDIFNGVIEVVTPDGQHLKSRPLGLSYDDGSNTVWIAKLKHSEGYLMNSNQVIYPDAFTDLKADLVCTYRRNGFESDLVFRQCPPAPDQYGLNTTSSTLRLVTEFFNTADPQQIAAPADKKRRLQDRVFKFGSLNMTHGRAFAVDDTNSTAQSFRDRVPVNKSWIHAQERTFLAEAIPFKNLANDLSKLPGSTNSGTSKIPGLLRMASSQRQMLPGHDSVLDAKPMQIASIDPEKNPGVVLDYNTITSDLTDFTFINGITYYIGNECNFSGTTTFEGGAVIKASGAIDIDAAGTIVCPTDPSQPVVFTSPNDDSIGEVIDGSSGSPNFMDVTTYMNINYPNPVIRNMCFNYGYDCINDQNGDSLQLDVWDCQFLQVDIAIEVNYGNISLHNVLVQEVNADQSFWVYNTGDVIGENITVDGYPGIASLPDGTLYLTNSLIANSGGGVYAVITNISVPTYYFTPTFQTAGRAAYYLAASSPYRNLGTTGIDPDLLAELRTMTTYAPQDGGFPDTDTIDMGYHYPTNEDSDYDGIPDWWIYKYFGNYDENATNLDSVGNTLLYDYQNGQDPDVIAFYLEAPNDFVNQTNVTVQLNITAGWPADYAIFVDNTLVTNWLSYAGTNLTVNLSPMDGVHEVYVGLKGVPADATQTWQEYAFTLDRVGPTLTITNPVISGGTVTVIKPYLQLKGQADEPLYSLSYDISNSTGVFTNQSCFVYDQVFDHTQGDFTTNFFGAYDVPLATNSNIITLRVTDRAGNTTTTNFSVTLDYSGATTPPAVQLIWPQDGMLVSGTNVTMRGTMSDETGTIVAQVVNGNGTTNIINGIVERNNMFWLENVPLNGTNVVSLSAMDAAGNVTVTNFTIYPSTLQLTIDSTPTGDSLYQPQGTVSGTVSDSSATVTVNGTSATVNPTVNGAGTYNWSVTSAPVNGVGTATFDARAVTGGGGGGSGTTANASADPEKGPYSAVTEYYYTETINNSSISQNRQSTWQRIWDKHYQSGLRPDGTLQPYSGTVSDTFNYLLAGDPFNETDSGWINYSWSPTDAGSLVGDQIIGSTEGPFEEELWDLGPDAFSYAEYYPQNGSYYADKTYSWIGGDYGGVISSWLRTDKISARTKVQLYTGGKGVASYWNLFGIQCSANELLQPPPETQDLFLPWAAGGCPGPDEHAFIWYYEPSAPIGPTNLLVGGRGATADGTVWVVFPDNSVQDITVNAVGKKHFSASASPTKYPSHLDVYVCQPYPDWPSDGWKASSPDYPGYPIWNASVNAGHVWWKFSNDAPSGAVGQVITAEEAYGLGQEVGYGPVSWAGMDWGLFYTNGFSSFSAPGELPCPNSDSPTVHIQYTISFNGLTKGLGYTYSLYANPGTYEFSTHNDCTTARTAGVLSGVALPGDWLPEYFGYNLR